ncbi:MAG: diacylglycerol kinase family protein [Carnobacterium sp.]|uniref:diacylglycerol/lipid kinase family protein n=1 Tax=Carnobacterium sp. TaxID=48221 RepID=UPI003C741FDA
MKNPTKIHIIVNELSGSGNGKKVSIELIKLLNKKDILFSLNVSRYAGHTICLASTISKNKTVDLIKKNHLLLIIGGDGTLHEALIGLGEEQKHIPLAYIPAGSGNDFAKGLEISKNVTEVLAKILKSKEPKKIDILHFYEHFSNETGYAVNNIGVGFDAATVKHANLSSIKKKLNKINMGSLTYLVSLIVVLTKQKGFPIEVKIDGVQFNFPSAFLVTVNNHPYFGGGIEISPKASPYDNYIDLIVLEKVSISKIIFLFILMLSNGRHLKHKDVHYFRGSHIHILSNQSEDVQADGEFSGNKSINLSIQPSARYFWI